MARRPCRSSNANNLTDQRILASKLELEGVLCATVARRRHYTQLLCDVHFGSVEVSSFSERYVSIHQQRYFFGMTD